MSFKTFAFILFIIPSTVFANDGDQIDRIKWEENKDDGTWKGAIGDAWVVSASSRNEHGVSEIQMVICPGTAKRITVFCERDESKKFRHFISVPVNFPYEVNIKTSKKHGGLLVTVDFGKGIFWIISTDPERNFVGINN